MRKNKSILTILMTILTKLIVSANAWIMRFSILLLIGITLPNYEARVLPKFPNLRHKVIKRFLPSIVRAGNEDESEIQRKFDSIVHFEPVTSAYEFQKIYESNDKGTDLTKQKHLRNLGKNDRYVYKGFLGGEIQPHLIYQINDEQTLHGENKPYKIYFNNDKGKPKDRNQMIYPSIGKGGTKKFYPINDKEMNFEPNQIVYLNNDDSDQEGDIENHEASNDKGTSGDKIKSPQIMYLSNDKGNLDQFNPNEMYMLSNEKGNEDQNKYQSNDDQVQISQAYRNVVKAVLGLQKLNEEIDELTSMVTPKTEFEFNELVV